MSQPTADTVDDILYCARYGELEELVNANFPISYLVATDESGNTALHMACANGHLGMDPVSLQTKLTDYSLLTFNCLQRSSSIL